MPTRHTPTTTVVAIAAAGLIAGCGSGSPSGSANFNHHGPKNPVAAAFAFARCIQRHGVPNFPDPVVHSTAGGGSISQAVPGGVGTSPAFSGAMKACRYLAPGPGSSSHEGPGKLVLLAFAQCLRSHGVSGFPDPNAQGQLTLSMIQSAGVDLHAPSLLTAARRCVGVTHGAITMAQVFAAVNGHH
jgi:hypothetical protein